ncbi:parkin coregulated protein [Cricetulus griseus]|nr:parkin coregulated protein [Cricetulus griseus]
MVGEALVPYYRQILPILNIFKNMNGKNLIKKLGESVVAFSTECREEASEQPSVTLALDRESDPCKEIVENPESGTDKELPTPLLCPRKHSERPVSLISRPPLTECRRNLENA